MCQGITTRGTICKKSPQNQYCSIHRGKQFCGQPVGNKLCIYSVAEGTPLNCPRHPIRQDPVQNQPPGQPRDQPRNQIYIRTGWNLQPQDLPHQPEMRTIWELAFRMTFQDTMEEDALDNLINDLFQEETHRLLDEYIPVPTRQPPPTEKPTSQKIECSICLDLGPATTTLSCDHNSVVCQECVQQMFKNQAYPMCPICRQAFEVS